MRQPFTEYIQSGEKILTILKSTFNIKKALTILIILIILISGNIYTQNLNLIKSEELSKGLKKTYLNNDSSVLVKIYDKSQRLKYSINYLDLSQTVEHGDWILYHKNGAIEFIGSLDKGEPVGVWKKFTKKGDVIQKLDYNFDMSYASKKLDSMADKETLKYNTTDPKFIITEMPTFDGGDMNKFRQFIVLDLNLTIYAFEKYNKTGKHLIYASFTIDEEGILTNLEINNHGKPALEKEVARIIRQSPKWKPGFSHGIPQKVHFTMPVVFVFPG